MKKQALLLVLAVFLAAAVWPAQVEDSASAFRRAIEEKIRASSAEVGLAFKDMETGETLAINERLVLHAASTMKVPVMIEVFRLAGEGKLGLEDRLPVKNEFQSIIDGSPFSLSPDDDSEKDLYQQVGREVTIGDLVARMITVSSNLATNLLIERVGIEGINRTLDQLSAPGLRVIRCLDDSKAFEKGLNNTTDATSLQAVLEALCDGRAGSEAACREMVDLMAKQAFRENIPAGLPAGVRVADKPGWITRICHDAAIVYPENRKPYILVVLTRGIDDHDRAARLVADISRIVYRYVTKTAE